MKPANLQEQYLNAMRNNKLPATFFLINGFQMKGIVIAFDQFTIIIDSGGVQELVYKHAISTIMPVKPIDISTLNVSAETSENVQ